MEPNYIPYFEETRLKYKHMLSNKIKEETYDNHSTQFDLSDVMSEKDFSFIRLQMNISNELLYIKDSSFGKESDPHITILYGLTKECDYFKLRAFCKDFGTIQIKIGDISKFESDEYDVIKLSVESKELHDLHNYIKTNFDNVFSFPDYTPHITLAYVQKGSCDHMLGPCEWTGTEYLFNEFKFSHNEGYKLIVPLYED